MTLPLRAAIFCLCLLSTARIAGAQTSNSTSDDVPPFERGTIELGVIGGTSLPTSAFRAKPDHHLTLGSLFVGRVMAGRPGRGSLQLLVDVTPFVQVRQPGRVAGFATAPLFIRWNFPPMSRRGARLFAEISGSLLFTSEPVPPRTTTFNFLDQGGIGLRMPAGRRTAWLVGYRFQHISNGGRVRPNPGLNFNLVYGGLSLLR